MQARTLRIWGWIHTWSSLVCTLFMLLLCLTGLPLIFSDEIHALAGHGFHPAPAGEQRARLDDIATAAQAAAPGRVPLYFFAEADEPDLWYVKLDTRVDTDESAAVLLAADAGSGAILGTPELGRGFMGVVYRLHVDLFAGLAGKLFLGLMGLLLVVSLVSGVVLYAPFMRKLEFGSVRRQRTRRIFWLDQHNLLGIVTLVWTLVVGATGVVNTWADLILKAWQAEQAAQLGAGATQTLLLPLTDAIDLPPAELALQRALAAAPGMRLDMIAWPGTLLSTPEHFAVILHGNTPLTARLSQRLLVSPQTGEVLQAGERPGYITAFQLSQPLHFGDYGGLPLKVLWAALDLLTLVVLGSGLYLWLARRRHHLHPAGAGVAS